MMGLRRGETTLIEEFHYPRLGPGQMWEAFADRVEQEGIQVQLNSRCTAIRHRDTRAHSVVIAGSDGTEREHDVAGVLSSIPLRELILPLDPAPPPAVTAAAREARYRELCLVTLMVDQVEPFPDNSIYLHDPKRAPAASRISVPGARAWSLRGRRASGSSSSASRATTSGRCRAATPSRWRPRSSSESACSTASRVFDGVKVRVPRAYPMYDSYYRDAVDIIRPHLADRKLTTFGRNGLHRYNNQDHSMGTAILATLNMIDGADYDVWSVNTEADIWRRATRSREPWISTCRSGKLPPSSRSRAQHQSAPAHVRRERGRRGRYPDDVVEPCSATPVEAT